MPQLRHRILLTAIALLSGVASAGPPPPGPVGVRVNGYKELGAAFKAVNDSLRQGDVSQTPRIATRISAAARAQYGWFPAGSGPRPGISTAARPEIWTRAAEFRAAQDRFAAQAQAFERIAASGNAAAIRTAARQLGGSCKGCHDNFRNEVD